MISNTDRFIPIIWRSRAWTQAAHTMSCIRCGAYPAMPCHYTGPRQQWYGKGKGIKCSDLMTADLCIVCHQDFDQYRIQGLDKWGHSEEFLHYIMLTIHRRLQLGEKLAFTD